MADFVYCVVLAEQSRAEQRKANLTVFSSSFLYVEGNGPHAISHLFHQKISLFKEYPTPATVVYLLLHFFAFKSYPPPNYICHLLVLTYLVNPPFYFLFFSALFLLIGKSQNWVFQRCLSPISITSHIFSAWSFYFLF